MTAPTVSASHSISQECARPDAVYTTLSTCTCDAMHTYCALQPAHLPRNIPLPRQRHVCLVQEHTLRVLPEHMHRVGPLYQHVFPPAAAPTLSFVGLPWKVVPFCQYELQSRWIARCLSGRARLPDLAAMRADVAAFYARLQADGVPQRWALLSSAALLSFFRCCYALRAAAVDTHQPIRVCSALPIIQQLVYLFWAGFCLQSPYGLEAPSSGIATWCRWLG